VVDDDAFVVSALAEVLEQDGFVVHVSSNGFSAARLARESRPSVVLLDWMLPERSGGDVLADLRGDTATSDMAIVVVTANARLLTAEQVAHTDGVVEKPFDVSELLAIVHRAVLRGVQRETEVAPVAARWHRDPARVRRMGVRRRR